MFIKSNLEINHYNLDLKIGSTGRDTILVVHTRTYICRSKHFENPTPISLRYSRKNKTTISRRFFWHRIFMTAPKIVVSDQLKIGVDSP